MVPDNPHEGPSDVGGGGGDDGSDPGPGSTGPAAPPLDDLVPDPNEPKPRLPEEDESVGDEGNGVVEGQVSSAMDVIRQRFEALDAENAPDYAQVLAESQSYDRPTAAMGEVARDPEAMEQLLGKSGLSPRSQQVARDLITNFTGGSGEAEEG
jgi:hypothetical protein